MKYLIILMLIIFFLLPVEQAWSDAERYRVEVLVLYHLRHEQEPREIRVLNDYSSALDFLQPPEEEPDEQPVVASPGPTDGDVAASEEEPVDAAGPEDLLNAVMHVAEPGPEMQEAWRRLRSSAPFRPLQYLAWEQGSNPPFPVLRVHDSEAVLVEDPWVEQRADEQNVYGVNPEDALPDPITYYRLDGTASLTRSRFLHLALAIEWREPLYDVDGAVPPESLAPASEAVPGMVPDKPQPTAFHVHRIEQRRSVRTGRMEYFDTPVLGVLAWVTRLDEAVTEPVPE